MSEKYVICVYLIQARNTLVSDVTQLMVRTALEAVVMRKMDSVTLLLDITDTNMINVLENTYVTSPQTAVQRGVPIPRWDHNNIMGKQSV